VLFTAGREKESYLLKKQVFDATTKGWAALHSERQTGEEGSFPVGVGRGEKFFSVEGRGTGIPRLKKRESRPLSQEA